MGLENHERNPRPDPKFDNPHDLVPEWLRMSIPKLPTSLGKSDQTDPILLVKYYSPDTVWTWYVIAFDGDDLFFGYIQPPENNAPPYEGYFSLAGLQMASSSIKSTTIRCIQFTPIPLSQVLS